MYTDTKILIMGRSGSGKDTLRCALETQLGYTTARSFTTRPRRATDETCYLNFISEEEAARHTDKFLPTRVNGYEYFTTLDEIRKNRLRIIEPEGAYELAQYMPDTTFIVIYCTGTYNNRKEHAISRAADSSAEEAVFRARSDSEDERFTEFERKIFDTSEQVWRPDGVCNPVYVFHNDYTRDGLESFIRELAAFLP